MNQPSDIELCSELETLESQLTELSPSALPEQMLQRMEHAMINWHTQEATSTAVEKIVPFAPEFTGSSTSQNVSNSRFHIWGAAAAIGLMVAVGAIIGFGKNDALPSQQIAQNSTTQKHDPSSLLPIRENTADINDSTALSQHFSNNITNASNEGITYAGEDQTPYRIMRIEYTKEIITTDQNGNATTIRVPSSETILIPVRVH